MIRIFKLSDKKKLRLKGLLIAFPVFIMALCLVYVTGQYLLFNPLDLSFSTTSTKIFDRNGEYLWEISKDNSVRNTPVKITDIPQNCKDAIVSIEDKTFWTNGGVDTNGLGRLFISLFTAGSNGGGSTISQQLVKNAYQRIYNRTPLDKVNEIIAAIKLNQYFSKDHILELYLNNIYFGSINYGIESASIDYFGKNSKDLNLAECAYLMGIPQLPGVYNPYGDVDKGKTREAEVLDAMVKNGYITNDQEQTALSYQFKFNLQGLEVRAPHYIQYLQDKYGIFKTINNSYNLDFNTPYNITTFYDYNIHKQILKILNAGVHAAPIDSNVNNAAAIVIDTKGNLITMVGSIDFFNESIDGKFNSALGLRQPGAVLNPFIYSLALSNYNKDRTYPNLPYTITVKSDGKLKDVPITNQDDSQNVSVSIEQAAEDNLIIPSERIVQDYDISSVVRELKNIGITPQKDPWCSEALIEEGCEMTLYDIVQALYSLKNGQLSVIKDFQSIQNQFDDKTFDLKLPVAQVDSDMLKGGAQYFQIMNSKKENGWIILTGDTDNQKDTMAFAINDNYIIAVWVGNTQGQKLTSVSSQTIAVPALKEIQKLFP